MVAATLAAILVMATALLVPTLVALALVILDGRVQTAQHQTLVVVLAYTEHKQITLIALAHATQLGAEVPAILAQQATTMMALVAAPLMVATLLAHTVAKMHILIALVLTQVALAQVELGMVAPAIAPVTEVAGTVYIGQEPPV